MRFQFQKIVLVPFDVHSERERLISFLTTELWPFHVFHKLSEEKIDAMISDGVFSGSNHECFWIRTENEKEIGFLRLIDLDDVEDGYPLFDLRIISEERGRGWGTQVVRWLSEYLFHKYPSLEKIAGTTRVDNSGMRKTFRKCGFAKEGHYRKDWASSNGVSFDTVKYSLLREDWVAGKVTPVDWCDEP